VICFYPTAPGQFCDLWDSNVLDVASFKPNIIFYGRDFILSTKLLNFGELNHRFLYHQQLDIEIEINQL
jgi:hypothetical protein